MIGIKHEKEIVEAAKKFGLDSYLVAAIVATESSFSTYAMRYEKHYKWLYRVEKFAGISNITVSTETHLQKFSYGLLQVMGANCREHGFEGFLPDLCVKPEVGLYWGCKFFAKLLKKHGDRDKAIASYNAGSPKRKKDGSFVNQVYVDKVLTHYKEFKSAYSNTESFHT